MEVTKGFFWHVHHETLLEWCFSYDERAQYIRTDKPRSEREIRLRLFQPVKGMLPKEVVEVGQAYDKARQAWIKANIDHGKANLVYREKRQAYLDNKRTAIAYRDYVEAGQASAKAESVYFEADRIYGIVSRSHERILRDNMSKIQELHAVECPNCPWNGRTIFPRQLG